MTRDAGLLAGAIELQGPALTVWFNILDYASEHRVSKSLTDTIAAQNPHCAALCKAYLEELAQGRKPTPELPGRTTEDRVSTAVEGFELVTQQLRDIRAARASVADLATLTNQIDVLATYNDLHDKLQSFQYGIGSFQTLLVAARDMDTSPEPARILGVFSERLDALCVSIGEAVDKVPAGFAFRDMEKAWLISLREAADKLQRAIDARPNHAYADVKRALYQVRTILRTVPSKLSRQMFATAENLQRLANSLDTVVGKLGANNAATPAIKATHDVILVISSTVYALADEHKLWQDIDNKLVSLSEMIERDATADKSLPLQFSPLWRNVEEKVQVLADLDPAGAWRSYLAVYSATVNDLLSRETVDTTFILNFEAYRDEAQNRMFQVDQTLRDECASIVRVRKPLRDLLEELEL